MWLNEPREEIPAWSNRLLYYAARLNLPWMAACIYLACNIKLKEAAGGRPARRVLINYTQGPFIQDIEAIFADRADVEVQASPTRTLRTVACAFLSNKLDHNCYLSDDAEVAASKERYRDFLIRMWRAVRCIKPFDAVLGCNFGYYQEQEFAAALEALDVPYVVLHKENLKSPGREDFFEDLYRDKRSRFPGRKILVYNELEKRLQMRTGIADEGQLAVVGMPRLDRIHRWREAGGERNSEAKSVLFFAFWLKTGFPIARRKPWAGDAGKEPRSFFEDYEWRALVEGTYQAVVRFASRRPDVRVVIKAKAGITPELLAGVGCPSPLPPNVEIVNGGDPLDLIKDSAAVVGFNSTSLLEAVCAGVPVVSPAFGEVKDESYAPFYANMGEAVDYAESPDELVDMLGQYVDEGRIETALPERKLRQLDFWLGNPDGRASERAYREIFG